MASPKAPRTPQNLAPKAPSRVRPPVQRKPAAGIQPKPLPPKEPGPADKAKQEAEVKIRPVQLQAKTPPKPVRVANVPPTKPKPAQAPPASKKSGSPESKTEPRTPPQEGKPAWLASQAEAAEKKQGSPAWQSFLANANLPKLVTAVILVALLIIFALAPAFRFQKLDGSDLLLHTREELLEASGLHLGQHFLRSYGGSIHALLTGRYEGAEEKILKTFPELRSLSVYFKFPSTLYFEAEERIPLAFLDVNDTYVTVDRFGVVTGSYQELPQGLPAIRGIEPVQMRVGEAIKTNADEALKSCVAVMAALVEADFESPGGTLLLPQTKEIRSSGYQRILLTFQPDGSTDPLRVTCSSTQTLKEDFLWLKKVLDSKVLQDKLPGNLDIYGSQLVFRPYKVNAQGEEEDSGQDYVWQDEVFVPQEDYPAAEEEAPVEEEVPVEDYEAGNAYGEEG